MKNITNKRIEELSEIYFSGNSSTNEQEETNTDEVNEKVEDEVVEDKDEYIIDWEVKNNA
ncbi:MAG: hypothetical protein KAI79_03165 [Bacteroidales bacterium]|nr:hypothetical protein [Bacteroidales bacterium]